MAARFPQAELTACDIQTEAVDFCAKTFAAKPVYSNADLAKIAFAEKFDLIWCGSLITHFNEAAIVELLKLFVSSLRQSGLLIFMTHGDFVLADMLNGSPIYMITAENLAAMEKDYRKHGFAFQNYVNDSPEYSSDDCDYGNSLTSPTCLRRQVQKVGGLRELYFQERGWCNHQDVFGFIKAD